MKKKVIGFEGQSTLNRSKFWISFAQSAIRYFKGKKVPLKFDYYMVRFRFDEYRVIQVFHERGPGYLSPKDVINFLFTEVNAWSQKRLLRTATAPTN